MIVYSECKIHSIYHMDVKLLRNKIKDPYQQTNEESPIIEEELDDFLLESMLEEEIEEFRRLLKLQKLLEIQTNRPQFYT